MAKFTLNDVDYPFDTDQLSNREVILLEKVTGVSIGYLVDSFNSNGGTGRNAFFWLARRRLGEHVEYDELDYNYAALQFIPDTAAESDADEADEQQADPTEASPRGANPATAGK